MGVSRIGPGCAVVLLVSGLLAPAPAAARGAAPATAPAATLATPDVSIPPLIATVGPAGGNGSVNPIWIATSADGSHVVYRTREALTAGDTNAILDLYDWSEADGVRLITAGSTTEQTYDAVRISADGEQIFFYTPDPLLPEDVDSDTDVYEWSQGQLTLASTGPTDTGASFNYPYALSPDGSTVYFVSTGRLTAEDTDDSVDLYRRTGGVVSPISVAPTAGNGPNHVSFNGMSEDGSHVFFQSQERLDPTDQDSMYDLYEWSTSGVALVSTGPTDIGENDGGLQASTADGTHVYFSTNGQLTSEDTDLNPDTYERFAGVTRLISKGAAGEEAGNYARVQVVSADGSRLVMEVAGRLTVDDTDNSTDLYVLDNATLTLLMGGLDQENFGIVHGMTPDGSRIVYSTRASLVGMDTDGAKDIYARTAAGNELVSHAPGDPNYGLDAEFWAMSGDARRITFRSGEPLDGGDVNADYDVAIWDDGVITRLPIPTGVDRLLEFNGLSTDGERLFIRTGIRLASVDTDDWRDIYQFHLPVLLTFSPEPGAPATVPRLGRFERQFQLSRSYGLDANDPIVIDVTGQFVSPTGRTISVPAYFGLDYTVQPGTGVGNSEGYLPVALDPPADGIWHVRFSPDEVGTWTYTLHASDHVPGQKATAVSGPLSFEVTPSAAHGQVERDPRDDRFLRYQDGTPYYPMGHNVAFQQGEPAGTDGERYVEPLFASMEAAGQNWTRIWMTDFNRNALEWSSDHWAGWYTGVGQYAGQSAFRIERQLDVAEEHRLQVQLVLNDHGQVRSMADGRWAANPYNAANGGPVDAAHPEQFFTNPEARSLFKQRLHYLVARYSAYRNLLTWELFNEVQFVGSDTANPYNSQQVRDDIVAWHAEMAAYLRAIDPYDHLITTSSDVESSLKAIWADPNIDLVQVHDYGSALTTRDARFRGYVASLNATYAKPVIVAEFGILGNPEINFDPVAAAPLDDRESHLLQATHLHNAAWASAMSGSGAMSWWWGSYIHSSPTFNRTAPEFPANERINPPLRDFFAGEDLAGMSLEDSAITVPASVVALGMDNGASGFAWIRDAQNEYGTGAGPGDIEGRAISGVRVEFGGYADGTYRIEVRDPWGVEPMNERLAAAVGGTLSVALPDFTRDIALKIWPVGPATAVQPVTVAVTSPNGGPVDITESTTPDPPPVGSGFTFLAFQLGITAPPASSAVPLSLVFTVDQALLATLDPDLTAATLEVFRDGALVEPCTPSPTDDPATPSPCVAQRQALVGGDDDGDARITVLTASASTWNFGLAATPPGAPTGVVATPGDARATVSWVAPGDDGNSPITGYTVAASPGGAIALAGGTATSATVTGLTNGVGYTFTVTATNAIGIGPASLPSNAVTPFAKANQTITFATLQNRTMLQTPLTVAATASSGLALSFATTTPAVCTAGGVNGATITLVGAGTCTVQADQSGNAAFNPAPPVIRSFLVSRVSQTITFGVLGNRTMLQTPFTVTATATSNLAVTFSSSTPTICSTSGPTGSTVNLLTAGTCTIVASQPGNATYSPAPDRARGFTVSFATQTITFPAITNKTMLQSPVTASPTASSGLPVSVTTTTPAVCTTGGSNGTTITLVAPGTCTLFANQAGNGSYAPAPQKSVSFTVSRATQTITFTNPGNKTLIQSPLTVSASSSSGLTVTFTTTTPAVCTAGGPVGATVTFVTTGSCSVVAAQPGNATYAPATSITRTFTISQAFQSITFAALPTRNILQSPFTVSATASSGLTVTVTTSSGSVCTAGGPNGTSITLLRAGTCKVVASQAGNATYKAASNVTQSFTVTTAKLAQSITFSPLGSRSIGAPALTLTATASSGLPVSYAVEPASAAICAVTGSVLTLHDPGPCTVTASQAGNASFLAAPAVSQTLTATLAGFVQSSGTSLVLDGQPFQIFGASIYQTSNNGHTADPDQVFGWAADANLNTVRLSDIFLQTTNDPGAPYAEADWQWIDALIARAGNQGMKVILDLSSYRNWLVWSSKIDNGWVVNCEPKQDRSPVDYAALDPYTVAHRADWTTFMTFVANRVNTVSGIRYRNDPTILVVSIAGEPIGAGYLECGKANSEQELTDFFVWALAEWKSLDPHHLRSTGGLHGTYAGLDGNGDPIPSGQLVDGIAIFGLADNTLPSVHTYPPQTTTLPLADGQTPVLAPVAQALGKPWFTEEFGFRQEEGDEFRATEFDAIYDAQTAYGSAGSLFWNLGPELGVGTFDVNPSTPLTWARVLAQAP